MKNIDELKKEFDDAYDCDRDDPLFGLKKSEISEDMIRVSVGIEDISDIKADFKRGFKAAERVAGAA